MAKKYLLYIHDSATFDRVDNKSELVNDLLEKHWSSNHPGSTSTKREIVSREELEIKYPKVNDKVLVQEPTYAKQTSWGA